MSVNVVMRNTETKRTLLGIKLAPELKGHGSRGSHTQRGLIEEGEVALQVEPKVTVVAGISETAH